MQSATVVKSNLYRRRCKDDNTLYIGLDIHKATISVAVAEEGRCGKPHQSELAQKPINLTDSPHRRVNMANRKDPHIGNIKAGALCFSLAFPLCLPALLLFVAGDWGWIQGWIWGIWFVIFCSATTFYLYFYDPQLLKERMQPISGIKKQKKEAAYVIRIIGICFIFWLVIMPLDSKRYVWTSHFPIWLQVIGIAALLLSSYFIFRAMADNTFASGLIRIQSERHHHVISNGVYGFVRHPMYLGAVLLFIGTPLLLGSLYGIAVSLMLMALLAYRTIDEEKMLVSELKGYSEYMQKVRYRFVPLLW